MKEKILIEVIITNQCNKCCSYCKLDFKNKFISEHIIYDLVKFIKNNLKNVEYFHINFFGGEPLLGYEQVKKIIKSLPNEKIYYSIGTNGILLNKKKLEYFKKKKIEIYLSIDTETGYEILKKKYLKLYKDNITINFILNPKTIENSFILFEEVISIGFKKINIMPVLSTINWDNSSLFKLQVFIKKISLYKDINILGYFNGVSIEKQFVLDTNGILYQDLDSLLWIQKQNISINQELRKEINNSTFIGIINNINFEKLVKLYSIKTILKMVFKVPVSQGVLKSYEIINRIIYKYKENE